MSATRRISRRADKTWKRLASWYGARLAEQYGEAPPEDWCVLIDRTDDERLDDGLLAARRASPVYPPTLGQIEALIPKREWNTGPSKPSRIAALMLAQPLCEHQLAMTWSYFGPPREFQLPKIEPPVYVTHPDPRGAVVGECRKCGKTSFRALLEDAITEGVAA